MVLAEERYTRIITILKDQGFAKVDDLAQVLKVSDMTIRRDLDRCQERGILQRCHGGALMNRPEISFEDKSGKNREIKKSIARKAASFVEDGMTVFLDAGTTTYELARLIRNIPRLTIVTDDVHIMYSLLDSPVELICIGGVAHKKTGCILGRFSEQMAEQMHFDISFIGTNAVDEEFCSMTPTQEKMFFKRVVLRHSGLCYLVADHSKFNKKALYMIDSLDKFSGVITDYAFTDDEQRLISEKKITVIAVENGESPYERMNA
ncbi:MAG: DeoR/GlpR family DNA-binding transcription regulator [Spirochaetaceae bacterium]|jgi:DeoR/GlpR family transcriptional regulator of sugar metabolism|nr:DeoR/GlpR family DNA-binding transcription regulator [Spirochaetaceae bacterium]